MSLVYAAYVGVPAITIPINVGLAAWIYRNHEDVRGSRWFVLTLAFGALWMAVAAVEFLLPTARGQIIAIILSTKFAILAFTSYAVFASLYTGANFHRHWTVKGLIVLVCASVLTPTWIQPFMGLFYANWFEGTDPIRHVVAEPGPLYAPVAIAVAILSAYALYVLVRYLLSTPRRSGLQLVFLVVGALSIMIAIALGNLGVFPIQEATNARFGALPYSLMTALALFRFRLFEMRPVARNAVVENLRDPVLVLDPDLHLVDYNPASLAVWPQIEGSTGTPIESACPDVASYLNTDDPAAVSAIDLSVLVGGKQRHFSLDVSAIGGDDGPTLYAVLLRDVTELERSRRQLRGQNERLDQVAATISHDLRNPINVAEGYAEMADQRLASEPLEPDDVETARDALLRIKGAHERMAAIIDDVLTLAREGQSVGDTDAVSLRTVAHEAWEHVDTGDATLNVVDDRGLAADRSKLLTLLENLFRNAVEHGGETVTVTVGPLEDGFSVADDGPGVPPAERDDVFEYGYTTSNEGTGLGLSIVRTIADSHGWTVALDAEYEAGARFVVHNVDAADPENGPSDAESSAPIPDSRQ